MIREGIYLNWIARVIMILGYQILAWLKLKIDNLWYVYFSNSNKIKEIYDSSNKPEGFDQNGKFAVSYGYDNNGNLTYDPYKEMTISYNYLNLPELVSFNSGESIEFTYTSSGALLKKEVNSATGGFLSGVEYFENLEWRQGYIHSESFDDFRVSFDIGIDLHVYKGFEYNIKDHLGNTRLTFLDANNDGTISVDPDQAYNNEVFQENHYYPFGLKLDGWWMDRPFSEQDKKYNGKELHQDHGFNWYNYGARFYDPVLSRFTSVDPLSSSFSGPFTL